MDYIPHTTDDTAGMLGRIGVRGIDDLFRCIPAPLRFDRPLDVPGPRSEPETVGEMGALARRNRTLDDLVSFLGGGAYNHFIPSAVEQLASRSEFYTAYTPYQAEASQGSLQAFFEYQTMIAEICGMDVANASHYEGATAAAEGIAMALDYTGRGRVLVSSAVHPDYRAVLRTFFAHLDVRIEEVPHEAGATPPGAVEARIGDDVAAVVFQSPNVFGIVEDGPALVRAAKARGAMSVAVVDPVSLGLLKPPGHYGADIAVGEGQGLGAEPAWGGPWLGFMATRQEHLRKIPGRIVGQTVDSEGKRAFVLTLQAREQHIRREKASSNICTNQALLALRATIHLAYLGKQGFRDVADLCLRKAGYLADEIRKIPGFSLPFPGPFFKEFVVRTPKPPAALNAALLAKGFLGGLDLAGWYPDLGNAWLLCATERTSRGDIDQFIAALREAAR